VLQKEVVKDLIMEQKPPILKDNVVVIIHQMGEMAHQQEKSYHR
jgi:hypothetical protein